MVVIVPVAGGDIGMGVVSVVDPVKAFSRHGDSRRFLLMLVKCAVPGDAVVFQPDEHPDCVFPYFDLDKPFPFRAL